MPPGYFSGHPATIDDVRLLQRHLTGAEPLQPDAALKADLNADGRVDAIDLLLLNRLAAGTLIAGFAPPRIDDVQPAVARTGTTIRIRGRHLAAPGQTTTVAIAIGGSCFVATATTAAGGTEAAFDLPAGIALAGAPAAAAVRALVDGVPSNAATLGIVPGPLVRRIEAGPANAVHIIGEGFGADLADIEVIAGGAAAPLTSVSEQLVVVANAADAAQPVEYLVVVRGIEAPAAVYQPMRLQQGSVTLPPGSGLLLTSLRVSAGTTAPVNASGRFDLPLAAGVRTLVEVADDDHHAVLMGLLSATGTAAIDAASTALALLFRMTNAAALSQAGQAAFLSQVTGLAQTGALAAAITAGHPARPLLKDLLSADAGAAAALASAAAAADVVRGSLE